MKVFTCTDHSTHWPVGGASVVVAESEAQARYLLEKELRVRGLDPNEFTLKEIALDIPLVVVLRDGDY